MKIWQKVNNSPDVISSTKRLEPDFSRCAMLKVVS